MRRAFALAFVASLPCAHESAAQAVYTNPHDLMVDAIRSGRASGTLGGPTADLFARQFGSGGTLLVRAEAIGDFPQPECKRLRVVFTKKEAAGAKGLGDVTMTTAINYCLNGSAPGTERVQR